jgi:UDP-N-acetylmuramoyl-L-alanyl-D-glutamate--2,6-diaminopimelate ligase
VELRALVGAVDGPALRVADEPGPTDVAAIVLDSREVTPGALFCCVRGANVDAHELAPDAVARGAAAVLVDHALDIDVAQVIAPDVRAAVGPLAAALHGHPSRQVAVVGVTGTNGKTTVTYLLRAVLGGLGHDVDVIGTLSGGGADAPPTTPDAPALQQRLAAARDGGRDVVAMEVSSHALAQHRVAGTWFDAAIFTNLGRDHLDFHGDLDAYFAAKAALFTPAYTDLGITNLDDPHGRGLLDRAGLRMLGYSLADVEALAVTSGGSAFTWRGDAYEVRLGGRFNVSNALAALTYAAERAGDRYDPAAAARGLAALDAVPGRWEPVDAGQQFTVLVDYAHTPDAITGILRAARDLVEDGRVIIVFGAGGDKDRGKRPEMGAAAAGLADLVVLTSDNPRSEEPSAIIEDVRRGIPEGAAVVVEPDRRAAIALAIAEARPGDVVLVAGKGHEVHQEVAGVRHPFDDRAVARELLEAAAR